MVRLAQPWSLRYPLIDGQGNFGSVDGDPPAAYRYTESRLTEIAEELLADIDKDTVDFVANFDDTTVEPVVLPTRIPNLLVNGSNGIAVGMATNIPPHNLTEITNACITLVNNPHATLADILKHVQGPDFPTGGFIHGRSGITEAYRTGRGRFMMRAKAAIEHMTKDKDAIVVTEIPYQVNKSKLIERIAELVNNKVIDDISDVRDESDRDGMRIVIELKRGTEAADRAQPALQAHLDAGELQHDLPGRGQRPAQRDGAGAGHPALRGPSHRRGAAPHRLPADEGPRARAHPGRLPGSAGPRG